MKLDTIFTIERMLNLAVNEATIKGLSISGEVRLSERGDVGHVFHITNKKVKD